MTMKGRLVAVAAWTVGILLIGGLVVFAHWWLVNFCSPGDC